MKIFFYCSYEHSKEGFFLTEFDGEKLNKVNYDSLPKVVEEFFSYDRFYFLWKNISAAPVSMLRPAEYIGSFCGIRDIKGYSSDGRYFTANIAFLADVDEIRQLERTILTVLSDFRQSCSELLSMLSVCVDTSYKLDCVAFKFWLDSCAAKTKLHVIDANPEAVALLPYLRSTASVRHPIGLLRFAVISVEWNDLCSAVQPGMIWRHKPRCVLTREDFSHIFIDCGRAWVME